LRRKQKSTFRFYNILSKTKLIATSWLISLVTENNLGGATSHEPYREKSTTAPDEQTKKRKN